MVHLLCSCLILVNCRFGRLNHTFAGLPERAELRNVIKPSLRLFYLNHNLWLAKEMARKASHDDWLSRVLGSEREFSWGSVWSDYDDRGGFSEIAVMYGEDE